MICENMSTSPPTQWTFIHNNAQYKCGTVFKLTDKIDKDGSLYICLQL